MTLNKSSYTPSNSSLITVQEVEKGVKEEVAAHFEVISRQFGSRAWRKPQETSVRIAGARAKILKTCRIGSRIYDFVALFSDKNWCRFSNSAHLDEIYDMNTFFEDLKQRPTVDLKC